MKKALVAGAVILAVAFASPALAATKKKAKVDASTCQSMMQQLDDAIASHASDPKIDSAKKQREEGDKACSAKKYYTGVKHLRLGLKDLGVKPVHK
jgi:hypothetical protein